VERWSLGDRQNLERPRLYQEIQHYPSTRHRQKILLLRKCLYLSPCITRLQALPS